MSNQPGQHEAEKHQCPFEYERSEPRRQTDHDREQNHQLFIGQPLGSDDQVAVQQRYFVSRLGMAVAEFKGLRFRTV